MPGATLSRAEAAWEALNKHKETSKKKGEQLVRQLDDTPWSAITTPAELASEAITKNCESRKASGNLGASLVGEHTSKTPPILGSDKNGGLSSQSSGEGETMSDCTTSGSGATPPSQSSKNPAPNGGVEANLVREVNALTDPSAVVRKRGLTQLRRLMLGEGRTQLQLGKDDLQVLAEGHVLKPLLRRFGDCSSACRELALEMTLG